MTDTPPADLVQLHIRVDGHVQGVGFRYFVYDFAQAKALTGWVRNRHNGEVEVLAEGSRADLEDLLNHIRRGPSRSMVTEVKFDWSISSNLYDKFSLLPTE
ncbi:MAG: acylphosphatase [Anaerolinea sp.]|nr:acylphosphatase [Anaerolinea sp.]